jgi:glycosyltransferase involved in cell wall biosynthesis
MRILLMEPASPHQGRGNASTMGRYAAVARAAGFEVHTATPEQPQFREVDLIHAHHAVRTGPSALHVARTQDIPLVISLGGTDLHGADGQGFDQRGLEPLMGARLVLVPLAADVELLVARGIPRERVRVVPRAVTLPPLKPRVAPRSPLRMLFLGGIRAVKGPLTALRLARELRAQGCPVHLHLVGPVLDPQHGDQVRAALEPLDVWSAPMPAANLPSLFHESDVLLNTSLAEGASNAILEALAHGLPVAALDCHGNRELLAGAPRSVALVFAAEDTESLRRFIDSLRDGLDADRAQQAQSFISACHDLEREAAALRAAWMEATAQRP